ncbi:hypothetical protein [Streptomyces sp. NPDC002769]|uniref:hypothetical protein n=1 Tax=Streptomyces sp. NPDC002769 TaxID=3154542 RepID=UPI00331693C8
MLKIALRGLTAAALLVAPLTTPAAEDSARYVAPLPLCAAVDPLPSAVETRDGHQCTSFTPWVDADHDSRNTSLPPS